MELVRALMRFFSYIFHGLLALFLLAISFLALTSDAHALHLDMLPWKGAALTYAVFFGALFGVVSVLLALRGTARVLFFIWSVAVVLFILKGYFFSRYSFEPGEFKKVMLLTAGSLIAVFGSWFQLRQEPAMKRKAY